jgi:hypothetical protein
VLLAAKECAGGVSTSIRPTPANAVTSRIICFVLRLAAPVQNLRCDYSS